MTATKTSSNITPRMQLGLDSPVVKKISSLVRQTGHSHAEIIAAAINLGMIARHYKDDLSAFCYTLLFNDGYNKDIVYKSQPGIIIIVGEAIQQLSRLSAKEPTLEVQSQIDTEEPDWLLLTTLLDLLLSLEQLLAQLGRTKISVSKVEISPDTSEWLRLGITAEEIGRSIEETVRAAIFYAYCCYFQNLDNEDIHKTSLFDNKFRQDITTFQIGKETGVTITGRSAAILCDLVIPGTVSDQTEQEILWSTPENALLIAAQDLMSFLKGKDADEIMEA